MTVEQAIAQLQTFYGKEEVMVDVNGVPCRIVSISVIQDENDPDYGKPIFDVEE